ncbi:hypothetical protein NMY22_g3600 [Coprinellus aureogranulatus]|nr:hypothetical protein NMY22_g3600 [Coprinellus aureogranulatus]
MQLTCLRMSPASVGLTLDELTIAKTPFPCTNLIVDEQTPTESTSIGKDALHAQTCFSLVRQGTDGGGSSWRGLWRRLVLGSNGAEGSGSWSEHTPLTILSSPFTTHHDPFTNVHDSRIRTHDISTTKPALHSRHSTLRSPPDNHASAIESTMKVFKKPTIFTRINTKLKTLKIAPCIPSSLDHISVDDESERSDEKNRAVLVNNHNRTKRSSPNRSPGEVRFKEPPAVVVEVAPPPPSFSTLTRAVSRLVGFEIRPATPRPPLRRSESEVMLLREDRETGEVVIDPTIERSPLDEAAYRYHYTLRRIRQQDSRDVLVPRPATPAPFLRTPPSDDLQPEQYSHLRDAGLISTSFDAFHPLPNLPAAQRHPKLASLFDWVDSDVGVSDSSADAKDKYALENERDESEVFLEAGLWVGRPRSTSSPRSYGKKLGAGAQPILPAADRTAHPEAANTAFYLHHRNHSADELPSVESGSTTSAFSPDPFSPCFTLRSGEEGAGRSSLESVTTEDGVLDSPPNRKYASANGLMATPSPTNMVSPAAPPNTPWDPASPNASPVSNPKEESRSGRKKQGKTELDKTGKWDWGRCCWG